MRLTNLPFLRDYLESSEPSDLLAKPPMTLSDQRPLYQSITFCLRRFSRSSMTLSALTVSCAALLLGCTEEDNAASSPESMVSAQNYSDSPPAPQSIYDIGAGIADITGEAAESNMFGYADSDQITSGIQQRQHARAFLVGDGEREVLMVVLDTGAMTQGLHQAVIKQLKARYPGRFDEDNVMITATHTHAAPGGISHYALYGLTTRGFQAPTFDAMLSGTLRAIDRAVASEAPGQLLFGTNELYNASAQRSRTAYVNNPEARDNPSGIDPLMQVIRLRKNTDAGQKDIAAINWFAVHPTSLTSKNTLVSGDNKGYAAWYWEHQAGIDYLSGKGFIAAFANSNPGDISPNLNLRPGSGPTEDQWQNAQILGQRQADAAMNTPMTKTVSGKIDYRQTYVDMSQQMIDAKYTVDGLPHRTCPAAYKSAFAAGSEEDGGGGVGLAQAGIANEGKDNVLLKGIGQLVFMPSKDLIACQETDQVTITMGTTKPYPMTPEIMPVQLMRVGDLAIISLPSEFTITAGLRLRKLVAERLSLPLDQVIFAGYANAYAGYNVTPEEYKQQDYEGASTHFGPHTLEAWLQNVDELAVAMEEGKPVPKGPTPRDLSAKQISIAPGVVYDLAPWGKRFGEVAERPQMSYHRGERAEAVFWSAHPKSTLAYELAQDKAGLRDSEPYTMAVQYNDGTDWQTIATDNDWNTTNQWQRVLAAQSKAKLTWDIPQDAAAGEYRFYHRGAYKKIFTGELIPFEGYSPSFMVMSSSS